MSCGCGRGLGEVPQAAPTLANRPDLIAPVAVVVTGLVAAGLLAAWLLSGEALGIETGSIVAEPE